MLGYHQYPRKNSFHISSLSFLAVLFVYSSMRRMRDKNLTALQMRKSMRQKNNVPVQICEENKAQINHASHFTEPICSFSLSLHYSISRRRFFPLQVLQMLDTSREVCQPLVWPSLCQIFTHVGCTRLQIQKKMRARGCRRLKEKCKQDKAIRNPDFPTKSSKLSWLLHKVYLITVFHNNKYLVLILWKHLANIHMEYSLSKNSN